MSRRRLLVTVIAALAAVVVFAGPAMAHVTVNPNQATKGGFAALTFRVPNEKDNANTTALEVDFPTDHPFEEVSVKPVPGWTYQVAKSGESVSKVTWTATGDAAIKPGEFQEFEISLGPLPKDADSLTFKALQTYSDGDIVRWIDPTPASGEEPEHPAPVLKLVAATESSAAPAAAKTDENDDDNDSNGLAVAGIVLGALGLLAGGVALARSRR